MAWISPTGHVANGWSDPESAYDGNTATYAQIAVDRQSWSSYLELTLSLAVDCDKVRAWVSRAGNRINAVEVDVYYDSQWNNIYSGSPQFDQWTEYPIGSTKSVLSMRIRMWSQAQPDTARINEAEFNQLTGPVPGWNRLAFASEPPVPNAWNQIKDDGATGWRKLLYEGE